MNGVKYRFLLKLKETKWFALVLLLFLFLVFPLVKSNYEKQYGVNSETLKMLLQVIYIFLPFLSAVIVTVSSRAIFEEPGNELLYLYERLSVYALAAFLLCNVLFFSSFLFLLPHYGLLWAEYLKLIFLSVFLSGLSLFLLTLTKTAVPSLLGLVSMLAFVYFQPSVVTDITGNIGNAPNEKAWLFFGVGALLFLFSALLYKKHPSYR